MSAIANGIIRFRRPVSKDMAEHLIYQLEGRDDCDQITIEGNEMCFEEYRLGPDMKFELNELNRISKQYGNGTVEGELEYYGDYDGGYVFLSDTGEWEHYDKEQLGVKHASDKELLAELVRRGTFRQICGTLQRKGDTEREHGWNAALFAVENTICKL